MNFKEHLLNETHTDGETKLNESEYTAGDLLKDLKGLSKEALGEPIEAIGERRGVGYKVIDFDKKKVALFLDRVV